MNESNFKLLPDDPKLTAYALGELEGAERAAVEAALRENPALGAIVDEIRAMGAQLETALAAEAAPETVADARASGGEGARAKAPVAGDPYARKKGAKVLQFPQVYFLVGGLAAACFAVVVALRAPLPPKVQPKHYVEVPLGSVEAEKKTDEGVAAKVEVAAVALPKSEEISEAAPAASAARMAKADLPVFDAKAADLVAQAKAGSEKPKGLSFDSPAEGQAAEWAERSSQAASAMTTRERTETARAASAYVATVQTGGAQAQKAWAYPGDEGMIIHAEPKTAAALPAPTPAPSLHSGSAVGGVAGQAVFDANSLVAANDEAIVLSPFSVEAPAQGGYGASSTLAGTRMGFAAGAAREAANTESYTFRRESDFLSAKENPLSTFSADVDTASYANVRRFLENGKRPPPDAVRIEELLNYFPFAYTAPGKKDAAPFAATMEVAAAPWAAGHRLVRIGLKGREVATAERGAANLVFLLDVSGSMNAPNRLPLVKESMHLLLSRLRPDDRVAIVVYAGASGLALPSTPVKQAGEIAAAIDELRAGGSTNGALGIQLAYDIAKANFIEGGINRVVLCTDGDFNVGTTSEGDLVRLITEKAKSKVFLTALGFGMGNYKDATLQQIADAGNGNYGYVDSRREAEKLLVEQVSGTLVTIAKDVKLQVEFNPAKVASYRLIGYEKRLLKKEDFNNDQVDAGEIGAGHAVTALYEIVPVGAEDGAEKLAKKGAVDELRYVGFGGAPMTRRVEKSGEAVAQTRPELAEELLTLKVRYKEPAGEASKRLEFPLADRSATFAAASGDFKFAAAVAGFGMILRGSEHRGTATLDDVAQWAEAGAGSDPGGYRAEFVGLVKKARGLE